VLREPSLERVASIVGLCGALLGQLQQVVKNAMLRTEGGYMAAAESLDGAARERSRGSAIAWTGCAGPPAA
jgi:hypothetical protein